MLTIVYARVSTEDQIDHSPEVQRRRCADFARSHDLGVPRLRPATSQATLGSAHRFAEWTSIRLSGTDGWGWTPTSETR